jgi:hypothetical protein
MKHHSLVTALLGAAALLTGCGGGGTGGYMPMMNLSSAPGEMALVNFLQAAHQNMLNASYSGNNYSLTVSFAPNAGTTTFNGSAPAYSTVETVTLSKNGTVVTTGVSTAYFLLNPYMPLGQVASSGSPYAVVVTSSPLPTTISVGTSGAFDTLTYYHDSTKATIDADESISYSVMANNSTTLLFCLNSTFSNVTAQGMTDGLANGTENDCYTVDATGTANVSSITVTVAGTMLTFQ